MSILTSVVSHRSFDLELALLGEYNEVTDNSAGVNNKAGTYGEGDRTRRWYLAPNPKKLLRGAMKTQPFISVRNELFNRVTLADPSS